MIGDWVSYNDKMSCKITALCKDRPVFDTLLGYQDWSIPYEKLKPIPITPEILEKNGFVKYNEVSDTPPYDKDEEGNMYYSYKGEHKFWGWWQPNNVYLIPVNAMVDLEIKFVHQLQHALRLCSIDKEITI
jgi:hypothetical protein